jgi:ribosomal protein S18 acetylase RimI-like enzyme
VDGATFLGTDLVIRKMTQNDLRQIKKVIDLSFPRFYRYFAFHSIEEGQVLVTEVERRVVGFVKSIDFSIGGKRYNCILWIAVHPSFRRKGIAANLTNIATQQLKQKGANAVFASTQRRNIAALSLLTTQGFKRMGFFGLRRLFGWRVFEFFSAIWFAPGEVVLMNEQDQEELVGRAGFEPATARYLWPRQARVKPTMGRPLQLLRRLSILAGSRALPG